MRTEKAALSLEIMAWSAAKGRERVNAELDKQPRINTNRHEFARGDAARFQAAGQNETGLKKVCAFSRKVASEIPVSVSKSLILYREFEPRLSDPRATGGLARWPDGIRRYRPDSSDQGCATSMTFMP